MSKIIQSQFFKFHDNIKLYIDDNKPVNEKKDMLLDEIRAYIKKKCEEKGVSIITFDVFNQGSYAMGTGIKPMYEEDDYDIDVALLFHVSKDDYSPIEVKRWVFEALDAKQFREVLWKKPCIRVQYSEAGFPKFHIDFAIYSESGSNNDGKTYLAKGKPTLPKENNFWEISEPKKLKDMVNNRFTDADEKAQFKRVIRYLKRWKDYQFDSVNGKPTGISLTALALKGFQPVVKNPISNQQEVRDITALHKLVKYIIGEFSWITDKISVKLPVPPQNDLFEKMTEEQHKKFKEKLEVLSAAIQKAIDEIDPVIACTKLKKELGDDFEVPPKEDTAQNRKKAIIGTSESA